MPTKIGPFEIISELANSPTGAVYKANDPESGQTVALKVIQLSAFGEGAAALQQALEAEAESTKVLSSPNITNVLGAGEFDGQFCAAMEYVQGNSIATMLARKEGFSIWDLLDIGRQLSSGFDHAASHNIVHHSLEPSKIMCGWDGTVKLLSFGVSGVGNFVQYLSEGIPSTLHYMSPEQILGQPTDGRSNLFSLGAMFYEMVTERKAFDGDDVESLRQSILESTPVPPVHVNPKVHPLLSNLIMRAMAKDPAQRYQNGRELLDDLEQCKESKTLAAKKPETKGTMAPAKAQAAAQSKFIAPAGGQPVVPKAPSAGLARPASAPAVSPAAARPPAVKPVLARPSQPRVAAPAASTAAKAPASGLARPTSTLAVPKTAAAAAGVGGNFSSSADAASPYAEPELDLSNQFITSCVKATIETAGQPSATMSSAVADEVEPPQVTPSRFSDSNEDDDAAAPRIAVDPMMAEQPKESAGVSFSEMTELPPLKEVYIPPPPPPPIFGSLPQTPPAPTSTMFSGDLKAMADEKPKPQPREVAEKAFKEIKNVPPKLMLYALSGAGILILLIALGVTIYIHSLNSDDDSGAARGAATAAETSQPAEPSQPAPKKAAKAPVTEAQPVETPEPEAVTPVATSKARPAHSRKVAAPAPVVIPGQLAIDSTPQGAQVQLDGRSDPSWITPFALTNLEPGQHSITISKVGYTTDTRPVMVTSGNRATAVIHLAQLMATLIVRSEPAGANIYVDGRDVGAKTPAQVSVDKGQHVVLVRMSGYLDETMNAQFVLGQTFNFAPTLRALGNTDNIKTVGKMSKLFGGKGAQAGQAALSIRTTPKGAQIAINQHILDKNSPVDVALDPGNYEIDITLTGYAPLHRVITADKGGKVVVDEALQKQ
jgi:serine/threonine-protein kinase